MKCNTCQRDDLEASDFTFKNKKTGKLHKQCKRCRSEYHKVYYLNNKDTYIAKAKSNNPIYYQQKRKWINDYKTSAGCKYCNEKRAACLDFHHTDKNKEFEISKFKWFSYKKLESEMRKCIVICSNCHRLLHYDPMSLEGFEPSCLSAADFKIAASSE